MGDYGLGWANSTRPSPLNCKPNPARFLLSKFGLGSAHQAARPMQGSNA